MDDVRWTKIAVAALLALTARFLVRLRNHWMAVETARRMGTVRCNGCSHEGPVLGYANFWGTKRVVCARCRSPAIRPA